jgi:hypothetical protein
VSTLDANTTLGQLTLPYSGRSNATRERSRKAAEKAQRNRARRERQVMAYLASCGDEGATDNELIDALRARCKMSVNTPRARRRNLTVEGVIVDSGRERDGCTVWALTAAGLAEARDYDLK